MDWPPQPSRREPSAPGAKALTAADLWTKAVDTARAGVRSSVAGITYAQAAERAVEVAGTADLEQIALWWIREKLDAGMFLATEWFGEASDLPLELGPENAARVVARAVEIWRDVVVEATRYAEEHPEPED
ncbi:MAG TPA: hypothetical protein PLU22_10005 [Polyangiaceae bacterium]|nr:hypothetical protein [Polyangiaceae bacterium]